MNECHDINGLCEEDNCECNKPLNKNTMEYRSYRDFSYGKTVADKSREISDMEKNEKPRFFFPPEVQKQERTKKEWDNN